MTDATHISRSPDEDTRGRTPDSGTRGHASSSDTRGQAPDPGSREQAEPAFVWPVRVYWEDTDAGGIVYYANYLRYMERARTEWLRSLGCDQARMRAAHGLQFVVARANVEFRRPGRLDDRLDVDVRVLAMRRASMELAQHVRCAGREPLCRAEVRIGCVDIESFRPRGIPISLKQELDIER